MGVGFIGVAYGLSYTILAIPLGGLSDRVGRKAIMAFASILSLVASSLYLFASRSEHLILIRAVEGVAWAVIFRLLKLHPLTSLQKQSMDGRWVYSHRSMELDSH